MFENLPWSSHHGRDAASKHEESLNSILPEPSDRAELLLLISSCATCMKRNLLDTFDAKQTSITTADAKTQSSSGERAWVDHVKADIAAQDKARQELQTREKDLGGEQMQALKTDALQHFDTWRNSVLERVGEAINAKDALKDQESKQPSSAQDESRVPASAIDASQDFKQAAQDVLNALYPPIDTPLAGLDRDKKLLIIHSMLLISVSLEHYSAYSRVLLIYMTTSLGLNVTDLDDDESRVARGLLAAADMKAEEQTQNAADDNKNSRKWQVGLATVAGAAIVGITGGLAAPLLAAGVGTVMGGLGLGATATAGYLGTLASSSLLVGGLFGAYGGRMTGKMMDQYAREVQDFAFVPVYAHHTPRKIEKEYRRLRVVIGISGWLTNKSEVIEPWTVLGTDLEAFALRYELEALLALGNALTSMISTAAWAFAKNEIIKRTIFASLTAALWPLGLLKISRIIDNPFSVAKARADKAGKVLADAIVDKAQGERPVTLIGYSLGARVIYTCLKRLAERKAFGLVESVVLIGAPTPSTAGDWRMIRSVVAGRVVNVYSTSDSILAFLYRSSSIQYGIAGLQPIQEVRGIQNLDVTKTISAHTSYRYSIGSILRDIGFEDLDMEAVNKQEEEHKKADKKQEQEQRENEQKANQSTNQGEEGKEGVSDGQVKDLEETVERKNEASMIDWASEKLQLGGASALTAASKAKSWYMTRQRAGSASVEDAQKQAGAVSDHGEKRYAALT